MVFVGRDQETNRIVELIEQNNNVIVSGKYGIGRTSLIRHIADITKNRWRFIFIDFSQTPARACQAILSQLLTEKKFIGRKNKKYEFNRFLLVNLEFEDQRQCVIVLDNIAKLSHPKIALIRDLAWGKRFLLVAIAEAFLPEKDFFLLRKALIPVEVITIQNLSQQNSEKLLQQFSEKYQFNWDDRQIKIFASIIQGYALGIRELVTRKLKGECSP
ncbi:MAG TPA: ATP-binding protein [Thermodesulfobacteriota bacterium]|nr:ATP-binding protein [Thermodesulfobacteriota bacterium]